MDRTRVRRELGRIRGIVAGVGLAGVSIGAAPLLACTLRCQPHAMTYRALAPVDRQEGESDDAMLARCLEVCRTTTGHSNARCSTDEGQYYCETVQSEVCIAGRSPLGTFAAAGLGIGTACDTFLRAQIAFELASVFAFEELAQALPRWGAPSAFTRAALRFADDERGHAARLFDVLETDAPVRVVRGPRSPDDLFSFAKHNASEACVGETFGACVAAHQARHAPTPGMRHAYAGIAVDEFAHARLALALDRWSRTRLTRAESNEVDEACRASIRLLRDSLDAPLGPDGLGLPPRDEALSIHLALFGA